MHLNKLKWIIFTLCIQLMLCEWVEIKQFSKGKTYLGGVTPFSEYIYTPSLVFTSTTESNEPMPLPRPKGYSHKHDEKKSISKIPDDFLSLTTVPSLPSSTKRPASSSTTSKPKQKNKRRQQQQQASTMKSNETIRRYDMRPLQVTVSNLKTSSLRSNNSKPVTTDAPKTVNKSIVDDKRDEFSDADDDDEYEFVYDDDEDDLDVDPETGDFVMGNEDDTETTRKGDGGPDYEYYEDEQDDYEDEDFDANEAKGNAQEDDSNGYSYATLLPYLQTIQSTLIRNSHIKTVKSKVSFLSDIKDRLLYAIQSKINALWPTRAKRETTRGDMWDSWEKGHGDKGMEFPSNEGALLTLGFLTFAVFLIKCILKLIHAIKGKHEKGGIIPIIIANGTANTPTMAPMTFRLKRDLEPLEIAKFMHNLENYKPH